MIDLQPWSETHRRAFIAMYSDPMVMADQGGPLDRAYCEAKFDRYRDALLDDGISRWAVVGPKDEFLGYAGVMRRDAPGPSAGPASRNWLAVQSQCVGQRLRDRGVKKSVSTCLDRIIG